jgi:hypothetical protein
MKPISYVCHPDAPNFAAQVHTCQLVTEAVTGEQGFGPLELLGDVATEPEIDYAARDALNRRSIMQLIVRLGAGRRVIEAARKLLGPDPVPDYLALEKEFDEALRSFDNLSEFMRPDEYGNLF